MNENSLATYNDNSCVSDDEMSLETLERSLELELSGQFNDLRALEEDFKKIDNPESLGDTVKNIVWEQFLNQVAVVAGKDFIEENRNLTLDLRNSAHIQSTENFAKGNIATHNTKIDYQDRYNQWHSKLQHNEDGSVKTHTNRLGQKEATLAKGARKVFDNGRPVGSVERKTDMDHVVSAGEIIRDASANAHLTEKEQIAFANSSRNINEMDAGQNRSKGDKSMSDWLDLPNSKGQRPNEIFEIDEKQDREYRVKDKEARSEFKKVKDDGEKRSIETGRQSQKEEAFRIGGTALKSAVMFLLADFMKSLIQKLIAWFRSGKRKFRTLIDAIKSQITDFINGLKDKLISAGTSALSSVATAIFGPIVGTFKKVWAILKQGYRSLKEAINYIRNPQNRNKSFSILMLEVGKIIIAGLSAGGALLLGEVIEKGLMTIPIFAIQIPLLGSLASILGLFFGAVIAGVIGAIVLDMINKKIVKKQRSENISKQLRKSGEIIQTQSKLIAVSDANVQNIKVDVAQSISERHDKLKTKMVGVIDSMGESINNSEQLKLKNNESLDELFDAISNL